MFTLLQASSIPTRRHQARRDQDVVSNFLVHSPPPPLPSHPPPPPPPASPSPPTTSHPPPLPPPSTRRRRTAASSPSSPQTQTRDHLPPTRCTSGFFIHLGTLKVPTGFTSSPVYRCPSPPEDPRGPTWSLRGTSGEVRCRRTRTCEARHHSLLFGRLVPSSNITEIHLIFTTSIEVG